MDKVIIETQVYKAWGFSASQASYTPPYPNAIATGQGVYVGIVDTGIDFKHLDFKPTTGTNKVKWIWDQTQNGNPPGGFTYGREWTTNEILTEVCTSLDTHSRGTHLAGIMAACGRATAGTWSAYRYVGMAPMANIVAVKNYALPWGEDYRSQNFVESKIRDAVDWCFQKAGAAPCVVLVPMGHYRSGHDGAGAFDVAIGTLSGSQSGKIVVCCSGNDGTTALHANVNLAAVGNQTSVTFAVPTYTPTPTINETVEGEAWHNLTASFSVRLSSPNGISTGWVTPNTQVNILSTADGSIQLQNALTAQTTSKGKRIYYRIYDAGDQIPPRVGTWKIEIERLSGTTTGVLDLWITGIALGGSAGAVTFTSSATSLTMTWSPGTADSVITSNSYVSKAAWLNANNQGSQYPGPPVTHSITSFTNRGPRRDADASTTYRPDITSPGYGIGSTLSADATVTNNFRTEDGVHRMNGTDKASQQGGAVTAGAIALFLEVNPNATVDEVRDWVRGNARVDSYTGTTPNATWGYGKLQAFPIGSLIVETDFLQHKVAYIGTTRFDFTPKAGTYDPATLIVANIKCFQVDPFIQKTAPITNVSASGFTITPAEEELGPNKLYYISLTTAVKNGSGTGFFTTLAYFMMGSGSVPVEGRIDDTISQRSITGLPYLNP